MTAYELMTKVIKGHTKTKERLLTMLDVFYAAGRMSDTEFSELVALVKSEYPDPVV